MSNNEQLLSDVFEANNRATSAQEWALLALRLREALERAESELSTAKADALEEAAAAIPHKQHAEMTRKALLAKAEKLRSGS